MSYALQTGKVPIRLVTLAGTEVRGDLFLHQSTDQTGRLQTIDSKLSEGARFLPLGDGGRVALLRTNWIAYLEAEGVQPEVVELEEIGALRVPVELELVTGETLRGDLAYLLPPGRNRVSDLLNHSDFDFLLLVGAGVTRYVRREAVARVIA